MHGRLIAAGGGLLLAAGMAIGWPPERAVDAAARTIPPIRTISAVVPNAPTLQSALQRFVVSEAPPVPNRRVLHVVASSGPGNGSPQQPFGRIDHAVAAAQPGDVVLVHRGTYRTPFTTQRDGRADAPIRIISGGARLVGDKSGRMVQILHDHVTLERFEISDDDILIWVQGAAGVQILNNTLRDAQGECVRIKYFSRYTEVAGNRITGCGQRGFSLADRRKNGEGIYIGTAPEQRHRNPTDEPDASNSNYVHDNVIRTRAECVDVKESAANNLVTRNHCSGSQDPDGAGFSSRGRFTIFRENVAIGNAGAGIRLGGDAADDGIQSLVLRNQLLANKGYGVKVQREPQRQICGNTVDANQAGATNGRTDPEDPC